MRCNLNPQAETLACVSQQPVSATKEHSTMARYLLEIPHSPEDCTAELDSVLGHSREMLNRFDWGCKEGTHVGWAIMEAQDTTTVRSSSSVIPMASAAAVSRGPGPCRKPTASPGGASGGASAAVVVVDSWAPDEPGAPISAPATPPPARASEKAAAPMSFLVFAMR
jgi:hypothetical protein